MTRENGGRSTQPVSPAPADVMFTTAVRAAQTRKGSAALYADAVMADRITPELSEFIAHITSFYLGSASADGQPYIQHRGGPPGFLRVVDDKTLTFADFTGNRQFITTGHLSQNNKAFLFLMDYARRQRIKIWGTAEVIEDDAELLDSLMTEGYRARGEQVIRVHVTAWDVNCPQHIPQRIDAADVERAIGERDRRIEALEAEIASFKEE